MYHNRFDQISHTLFAAQCVCTYTSEFCIIKATVQCAGSVLSIPSGTRTHPESILSITMYPESVLSIPSATQRTLRVYAEYPKWCTNISWEYTEYHHVPWECTKNPKWCTTYPESVPSIPSDAQTCPGSIQAPGCIIIMIAWVDY